MNEWTGHTPNKAMILGLIEEISDGYKIVKFDVDKVGWPKLNAEPWEFEMVELGATRATKVSSFLGQSLG
jgi:hypothetical protein